jgi:hypothetical protein
MANTVLTKKTRAITNTAVWTSWQPARAYVPTVGSDTTTATVTYGDGASSYTNTLIVITDDLISKYGSIIS